MPTYEYHCEKCKKDFELFQSMKDTAITSCPKELCRQKTWGKGKVRRLLGTGAGLIFKGSGFYITDYRSEGYKQAAKNDAAPAPAPASTDSKAAPKPESTPKPTPPKPASEPRKSRKKE
jgi:putative FmdB family regulatory protein